MPLKESEVSKRWAGARLTDLSDETGYFEFAKIPYGEYVIRKIEAPTGYILSDEIYPVSITEDGYPLIVMVDEAEILEIKNSPEEITDIPKTGVYTKFPLVCVLYIGLFTTLIIILKGRDLCLNQKKSK